MKLKQLRTALAILASTSSISSAVWADNTASDAAYSPYTDRDYPTQVYWGDTHLHTNLSLDARAFGVTLGVADAYRFARGEQLTASSGQPVKLSRPLDWLVVTDHSDGMGAMNEIIAGNPQLLQDAEVQDWHNRIRRGGKEAMAAVIDVINAFTNGKMPAVLIDPAFTQTIWDKVVATADAYNQPGQFTAMIGYEWTSTEMGNNLHRNVIYRDGAKRAGQMLPFTTEESFNPEDLWQWMSRYETATGGQVLALAHNGNVSNGIMFPVETNPETGKPLDGDYAKRRARWEPLYEITQIKGDGETHPLLSPTDEFADYETWDKGNLVLSAPKEESMLQYEYAREALKNGLAMEQRLGANPYKFGFSGATDSHTALATADEDNFFGKHAGNEPSPERASKAMGDVGGGKKWEANETVASGYTGVWARDNTREALFDAMMRKEVYATTGPRMAVRFFGGWDFTPADADSPHPAKIGYAKGVPMGGDLVGASDKQSPNFLIRALKDPQGANLDRVQVVKGWVDAEGRTHEQVYNVVWSNTQQRHINSAGKLTPVGNTVDVDNATWKNTIGASELATVWKDPDFNPQLRAFYYVRVLEIPTPRWTAYDAKRYGTQPPKGTEMITQERAYTSPIWYTP